MLQAKEVTTEDGEVTGFSITQNQASKNAVVEAGDYVVSTRAFIIHGRLDKKKLTLSSDLASSPRYATLKPVEEEEEVELTEEEKEVEAKKAAAKAEAKAKKAAKKKAKAKD